MKKTIDYTDGEIGNIKIIEYFLPIPEEIVLKDDTSFTYVCMLRSSCTSGLIMDDKTFDN